MVNSKQRTLQFIVLANGSKREIIFDSNWFWKTSSEQIKKAKNWSRIVKRRRRIGKKWGVKRVTYRRERSRAGVVSSSCLLSSWLHRSNFLTELEKNVSNDMRNSKWTCWITFWEHGLWVVWECTCAENTHRTNINFDPKTFTKMRDFVYVSTFLLLEEPWSGSMALQFNKINNQTMNPKIQ